MRCARYVINYKREYRDFIYGYEIELLEGNLVTEEVYTSHKFDITEFRVPGRRALSTYDIYESRDAAVDAARAVVRASMKRWEDIGKLFDGPFANNNNEQKGMAAVDVDEKKAMNDKATNDNVNGTLRNAYRVPRGADPRAPCLSGEVYGDTKGRFRDGERITTSTIMSEEGDVFRTRFSVYRVESWREERVAA